MTSQIAAYVIATLFFIVSELFVRQKVAKSFKAGKKLDTTTIIYVTCILLVLLGSPIMNLLDRGHIENQLFGWLGVFGLSVGIVIRTLAMKTLGDYYTRSLITVTHQKVIDSGPYRFIRHPGYAGTLLAGIGFGMAQLNVLTLGVTIVLLFTVYLIRIPKEERLLVEKLGRPYEIYMHRTKRLIPYVF